MGAEILVPAKTRRAIRDMEHPGTAYADDPALGSDPQPDHMERIYTGPADSGGVHLNSGIPNRAFVLFAQSLGGNAWETPGTICTRPSCSSRGPASSPTWRSSRPRSRATGSMRRPRRP